MNRILQELPKSDLDESLPQPEVEDTSFFQNRKVSSLMETALVMSVDGWVMSVRLVGQTMPSAQ